SFQPGFDHESFTVFEAWESPATANADEGGVLDDGTARTRARIDIGDGENIFYNKDIIITGVAGFNDVLGPEVHGHCTSCHNVPDVGNHSQPRFFDVGLADARFSNPLFTRDFPIYRFQRRGSNESR